MVELKKKGNTRVIENHRFIKVILYSTEIVNYDIANEIITFNTGGYFTNTTKNRMNLFCLENNINCKIYQKNYNWFANYKGEKYKFWENSLELNL